MLTTSNNYSNIFLGQRRILLDSCILNDWATDSKTKEIVEASENQYQIVFCNISMLEVGFGPSEKANKKQVDIATSIYASENVLQVNSEKLHIKSLDDNLVSTNLRISYNPSYHEYLAARTHLIRLMEHKGFGGKRARTLENDALIFFCAWNSRSALITNNVKDFKLFNEMMILRAEKHQLPIYTINDLGNSLNNDISFPENLEAYV